VPSEASSTVYALITAMHRETRFVVTSSGRIPRQRNRLWVKCFHICVTYVRACRPAGCRRTHSSVVAVGLHSDERRVSTTSAWRIRHPTRWHSDLRPSQFDTFRAADHQLSGVAFYRSSRSMGFLIYSDLETVEWTQWNGLIGPRTHARTRQSLPGVTSTITGV